MIGTRPTSEQIASSSPHDDVVTATAVQHIMSGSAVDLVGSRISGDRDTGIAGVMRKELELHGPGLVVTARVVGVDERPGVAGMRCIIHQVSGKSRSRRVTAAVEQEDMIIIDSSLHQAGRRI